VVIAAIADPTGSFWPTAAGCEKQKSADCRPSSPAEVGQMPPLFSRIFRQM
jgi:hypothetical protein